MNSVLKTLKHIIKSDGHNTVVCFDFFDTIVSRKYSPEEVKRVWAKSICERYQFNITWQDLYKNRLKREKEFYNNKENNYEFKYIELMSLIYNDISRIDSNFAKKITSSDFCEVSTSCEIMIEKRVQYLNDDIADVLDYCKENNLKMAVISDFYFGKEYINQFIDKIGLPNYFDNVFVSCDYYKSKRKGDMYEYIKSLYEGKPLVMIGDNKYVDCNISSQYGFYSILVNREETFKNYYVVDKHIQKFINKEMKTCYKNFSFLSNYAFSLYLFVERLYITLVSDGINEVCFLSRDGEFLKELFDLYQCEHPCSYKIKTNYLLVSRTSTYLPACKSLSDESFELFKIQYDSVTIGEFLDSISFPNDDIEKVLLETNCSKSDIMFFSKESDIKDKVFNCAYFKTRFEELRSSRKTAFCSYLKSEISDLQRIVLVDVGWKGTIQDNIFYALDENANIIGLYYGLTKKTNDTPKNKKYGLMFSVDDISSPDYTIYSFDHWFIENILTGSHGKVNSYHFDENNNIIIDYKNDSDSILYKLYIGDLRYEIREKFKNLMNLFLYTSACTDEYKANFIKFHFKLTKFFPFLKMKQNYIIRSLHSESFGATTLSNNNSKRMWIKYFVKVYGFKYAIKELIDYLRLVLKM